MITDERIIERFNETILNIDKAHQKALQNDLNGAQTELGLAANGVYQTIEWSVKKILTTYFKDPIIDGVSLKVVDGNSFPAKIDLFSKTVSPSPQSVGINTAIIKELKQEVRNNPEHSGFIPHYNSLIKVIEEARKLIFNYIDATALLNEISELQPADFSENDHWVKFYQACDGFDKQRNYILLIGPEQKNVKDKFRSLSLIDWNLVLDFDFNSEVDGAYSYISPELIKRRKVHQIIVGDQLISFTSRSATYWAFCNGLYGRAALVSPNFKEWSKNYSFKLEQLIKKIFTSISDKPTTLVCLWNERQFSSELARILYNSFGESLSIVYAGRDIDEARKTNETYPGSIIESDLPSISEGLIKIKNHFNVDINVSHIVLPAKDVDNCELSNQDYLWIEEDFEVVHKNILGGKNLNVGDELSEFLRGRQISWKGLHLHLDVDRDITPKLKKIIDRSLRDRVIKRIHLYHFPGIGGSTISRRIAWDLHEQYPVLVLRRYEPQETINKAYHVFQLTSYPPLIIADSAVLNTDDLQRLFNEVRGRHFPAIVFYIQRKEDGKLSSQEDTYLPDVMTDMELRTFVDSYIDIRPDKRNALEKILNSQNNNEKHPFFLGLTAFENSFLGLQSFIEDYLSKSTEIQKKIISIIALSYYYTQQPISAQVFANLLSLNQNTIVRLEKHLPNEIKLILINEEELKWRPVHYLIAQEILQQVLGAESKNSLVWKQNLADLSITTIKLFAEQTSAPSDSEVEILRRLFIYRDNEELLGKENDNLFSRLIEEGLLNDEARLRVLKQLTDSFPEDSHLWGHLARFYSFKVKNTDEALFAINKAIELSPAPDFVLYHVKGMCLRSKTYQLIDKWKNKKDCPADVKLKIRDLINEGSEAFEESRIINPVNEHPYISNIQLLIQAIDFFYSISAYETRSDYLRRLNVLDMELLNKAEELLDTVKQLKKDQHDNYYINACNLKLENLYENYSAVIEGWNNLLDSDKQMPKALIRRQLVRAYVRRQKDWNKLEEREISKIFDLINQNLLEEPRNADNIFLWFQAARQSQKIDINEAIEKLSYLRSNSNSLDSVYYLAILHTIQAMNNYSLSKAKAEELFRETSEKSRLSGNRSHCFEWLGDGQNLKQIINNRTAVTGVGDSHEITFEESKMFFVKGKISSIKGPEAGLIELECGLKAFFIPARADNGAGVFKDRDSNRNVKFYMGFSYDGLRAFNVTSV